MKIYTSYYGNLKKMKLANITPIQISIQKPKFLTEPIFKISALAPTYSMLKLEYDEYKKKYIEMLEKVDWTLMLQNIKENSNNTDVALCCYESLKKEGEWCHRTMLADYFNEKFGNAENQISEFVPDITKTNKTQQEKLF